MYIRLKKRRLIIILAAVFSTIAIVAGGVRLILLANAAAEIKGKGNYALGAPTYTYDVDREIKQNYIETENGKIDYLSFGDSLTAGYDAAKNKDILGYSNVLAKYLDDVHVLKTFDKYAFTGITSNDLRKVILGQISDEDWKSLIHDDKYRSLKRFTTKNGDPISLASFRSQMIEKIKDAEYITLQSGANNILNAISLFGVPAHDLFNPSYLVKNNLVPKGTSSDAATSIYMNKKINEIISNPLQILSNFSSILSINMDKMKQAIADANSDNEKIINFIQQYNSHVKITMVGYYNPIGWLGLIQKLAGLQKIINELNKAIAASATTFNNGSKEINVNFVANDVDFENFENPVESLGSRAYVYTRYDNVFKQYKTAKPSNQQIKNNQIYGGAAFFPHITDIHPSPLGQIALARRIYAFGFKPFLKPSLAITINAEAKDIKANIDIQNTSDNDPDYCKINEHSWIIKRVYVDDPTADPTIILDDSSFPTNNKYFPIDLRQDFLGDEDPWAVGKTINEMYANINNSLLFDNAIFGAVNQLAKLVLNNIGSGLVNGLSNGISRFTSSLNKTFVAFMEGEGNGWTKGDENSLFKFLMPAFKKLSTLGTETIGGQLVTIDSFNLTSLFNVILQGDPTSWGWNENGYNSPLISTLKESQTLWIYADDIFNEWFQNAFNNYFFNFPVLGMGMAHDVEQDSDWAELLKASDLAQIEYDMISIIDKQVNTMNDTVFIKNLAKNYWDLMERNSLLEGILRAKVQGMLKENVDFLKLINIYGELDLRNPVLVGLIVPAVIFDPIKIILQYAKDNPNDLFENDTAPDDIDDIIAKVDGFSKAFVDEYKKIAENYGQIIW